MAVRVAGLQPMRSCPWPPSAARLQLTPAQRRVVALAHALLTHSGSSFPHIIVWCS